MGSRYGRKRRRAHLAKIASLEQARMLDIQTAVRLTRELKVSQDALAGLVERVKNWNDHLREMLGRTTALVPEPTEMVEQYPGQVVHIDFDDPQGVVDPVAYETAQLVRIVGGLSDADLMTLKRYVHMRFALADGSPYMVNGKPVHWNYALSEANLQAGLTEQQIRHIGEQVAIQFILRMRQELGVGRKAA